MAKMPRDDDGLTPAESRAAVLRAQGLSQADAYRQAFGVRRAKQKMSFMDNMERKRLREIPPALRAVFRYDCPFCHEEVTRRWCCEHCGVWYSEPRISEAGPPGTHREGMKYDLDYGSSGERKDYPGKKTEPQDTE